MDDPAAKAKLMANSVIANAIATLPVGRKEKPPLLFIAKINDSITNVIAMTIRTILRRSCDPRDNSLLVMIKRLESGSGESRILFLETLSNGHLLISRSASSSLAVIRLISPHFLCLKAILQVEL